MIRRLPGAPGLFVVVILGLAVAAAWLRNTLMGVQKQPSDRALKRDITPVAW